MQMSTPTENAFKTLLSLLDLGDKYNYAISRVVTEYQLSNVELHSLEKMYNQHQNSY